MRNAERSNSASQTKAFTLAPAPAPAEAVRDGIGKKKRIHKKEERDKQEAVMECDACFWVFDRRRKKKDSHLRCRASAVNWRGDQIRLGTVCAGKRKARNDAHAEP